VTEIERKWLLSSAPASDVLGSGERLRQGYLAVDADAEVEVRIRFAGPSTVVTIKGGTGLSRAEVELPVTTPDRAEALWALTAGRRVEKVRHRVPVGELTAEVDLYEGALAGLSTAEVEFASVADAHAFVAPRWFGAEVTGERRWSNASLARHGMPR
jgi:CYTH domain-containing protein